MSRPEPKAGEWLRQQIEELGALRNASVRDPQFKAWRQNTLTFIQRIWPGDTSKSERFRRVPFSPPSSKADLRTAREYFERGCGEALEYLNTLLVSLGEEKVAPGTTRAMARETERFEGDFPVVELGAKVDVGEPSPMLEPVLDADGPVLDLPAAEAPTAPRSTGPSRLPSGATRPGTPEGLPDDFAGATPLDLPADAAAAGAPVEAGPAPPAPVSSRISVRGSAPPTRPSVNPLKDILAPQSANENPSRGTRNGRGRKHGKGRLKDMLGLTSLEKEATAAPPPAAPPAPVRSDDLPDWSRPEFHSPAESLPPLTAQDVESEFDRGEDEAPATPGPARPADEEPVTLEDVDVLSHGETLAGPGAGRDEAAGSAEVEETDNATAEFLRNSPVLSSTPRPVQRRGMPPAPPGVTQIPSRDSAASRMLAIASEVDALGIPAGHRARVRAALMDLARQLDEPQISWAVLRDAVGFVMEFPQVARRALPLLLPFLDVAA